MPRKLPFDAHGARKGRLAAQQQRADFGQRHLELRAAGFQLTEEAGAIDFITKPIDFTRLNLALSASAGSPALRRSSRSCG